MGKAWDDKGGPTAYQTWSATWAREAFRCLKPGGFLLAFGSTRMSHRMACGFEDAGFEIIDTIEWLYLTGFPKAGDISKMFDKRAGAKREVVGTKRKTPPATNLYGDYGDNYEYNVTAPVTDLAKRWDGWKTPALKPAHEPIVVARKPFTGTYIDNIEKWGVGAINVDGCRIAWADEADKKSAESFNSLRVGKPVYDVEKGWNANNVVGQAYEAPANGRFPANVVTLEPDEWYSKYFNITSPQELSKKASPSEKRGDDWKNVHPTVKPVELIRWLQRLVTPVGGTIASPFLGSGTDAVAAILEGFDFFGIEKDEEYWSIIDARVKEARCS